MIGRCVLVGTVAGVAWAQWYKRRRFKNEVRRMLAHAGRICREAA